MELDVKITKRQLRKIIKEALGGRPNHEAAYAVVYAAGYLDASDQEFGRLINKNPKLGQQGDKWVPLDDALGNINAVLIAGVRSIKNENPHIQLPEEDSVYQEGVAAGLADFRENIFKYIEQIDSLVTRETPMGMSAAEGLGVFGVEGGGVLFRDTALQDSRDLISLMDNDSVLSWLDEVEAMKQYGELRR